MRPIANPDVAMAFDAYPHSIQERLFALREVIFEVAASTEGVGEIEESLRWGEPAYLTSQSRSGSTVRLAWRKSDPDRYAVHFNCNTNLVERFRTWFPNDFDFDGNRSILGRVGNDIPVAPLRECIAAALTYHIAKRRKRR